ncbi:hypothetical protein AC579_5311 [Pseudocercospora musae]|uniref:CCHC-type domain-containing protein n=1 Tax=Pseudocercospora musae TaxID=113226 RepID=A0A139HZW4_9PEZI|nr:hypothetical protein AC579_5311 [Pseudocercospora musae]
MAPIIEVKPFTGSVTEDWTTWIKRAELKMRIELASDLKDLDSMLKAMFIHGLLAGEAREHADSLPNIDDIGVLKVTMSEWHEGRLKNAKATEAADAWRTIENASQGSLSVEQYVKSLKTARDKLPAEMRSLAVDKMLDGLSSKEVRNDVRKHFITSDVIDFDSAGTIAIKYDNWYRTGSAGGRYSLPDKSAARSSSPQRPPLDPQIEAILTSTKMQHEAMKTLAKGIAKGFASLSTSTQHRPTYQEPKGLPGPAGYKPRGGAVGPCYHCWDLGHLANECPSDSDGPLDIASQRRNYEKYCEYARSRNEEPKPFKPWYGSSQERRDFTRPRAIAANAIENDGDTVGEEAAQESEVSTIEVPLEEYGAIDAKSVFRLLSLMPEGASSSGHQVLALENGDESSA